MDRDVAERDGGRSPCSSIANAAVGDMAARPSVAENENLRRVSDTRLRREDRLS